MSSLKTTHSVHDGGEHSSVLKRSVSNIVLTGTVDIPAPPARLLADWEREMSQNIHLEPGDVEALPLARMRLRWPAYAVCVQAAADWAQANGLPEVLSEPDIESSIALMACRGARYHHDAAQYGDSVFFNLFLSEDKGLDVHFPDVNLRIPLVRGTVVIFDTAQTHAVIPRAKDEFNLPDFPPELDCSQVFLTWELPIENAHVAKALGIRFDATNEK